METHSVSEDSRHHSASDHRKSLAALEKDSVSDDSPTEDVEERDDHAGDESHSFIGVSIGAEQTRLAAPETPAVEKAAAIGDDPFAHIEEHVHGGSESQTSSVDEAYNFEQAKRSESPIDSSEDLGDRPRQQRDSTVTSALRSVFSGRPRASSNSDTFSNDRNDKKPFSISLPKFAHSRHVSLPTIDSAISWLLGSETANDQPTQPSKEVLQSSPNRGRTTEDLSKRPPNGSTSREIVFESATRSVSTKPPAASGTKRPTPLLRRTTSDGSLTFNSALSRASSLGDDSRWQDVNEQVNSRMKAIKDSLADSNFKLPRFKPPWIDTSAGPRLRSLHPQSDVSTETRDFAQMRSSQENRLKDSSPQHSRVKLTSPPGGMTKTNAAEHPEFSKALKRLTGDVVILGGYRGSILRSAEPPHRQLWVPIKVGLGVRKVNLEVGLNAEDDEKMTDTIIPSGMLKHIGPVDISRRLFKRLRMSKNARNGSLRIWDYGFDWRLNPEFLSRQLQEFLETLPSNKKDCEASHRGAIVIAHSLGGLITRHVANRCPELFSGILYAGVPQSCVNILGPLRNGDAVLLSSKVLTAQVNFTIRTSYALLPLDGKCFVDRDSKEEYRVDFFDPNTWDEYCLSPCVSRPLPALSEASEPQGIVTQLVESVTSALPSMTLAKSTASKRNSRSSSPFGVKAFSQSIDEFNREMADEEHTRSHLPVGPHMDQTNSQKYGKSEEKSISTAVTIPKQDAIKYLARTLAEVKRFKQELDHKPELEGLYPSMAVIYGKSTPTVYGASVQGREGIKRADAYDNLLFASGDGVVLSRAAQIPEGYHVAKGGVVSSERGHISLLGDLEAVGKCLNAILSDQRRKTREPCKE